MKTASTFLLTVLAAVSFCSTRTNVSAQLRGGSQPVGTDFLPRAALATKHFAGDAPWFETNIPFFTCSDPQIEQIYYYRWKLYKSHLKDLGRRGYIVTEFLDDVSWSLKPFESLNDATGFHIYEGRWLKDRRYVENYIDFMYHGGNDRHFSEAIADAAYNCSLVEGDPAVAHRNLPEMMRIYRQWEDHLDTSKGLYFIEPLLDATEYTISSIDASGGKDGFRGGDAFRPSINSFMFANARAISRLAALVGDKKVADEYAARAEALRKTVQRELWSDPFQHFVDRYRVNNGFVKYWDLIRGRELAGYTPWYFGLPDRTPTYNEAWRHLLSPDQLGGPYGLRTVEPSYEYYQKQYRYVKDEGVDRPECQWNGPSWPFQTTLALGGLANLLNDYPKQGIIGVADYVRLLQQYTRQHYSNGIPDLQEDYDPDTGRVIVGLQRSHHYNHSGYNDLVITGLVGLRPRADSILEVNPLIPIDPKAASSIAYFCLENVLYHGQLVTILYDREGNHYHRGKGLSIYVNGRQVLKPSPLGRKRVTLPAGQAPIPKQSPSPANLAVNVGRVGYPVPSASLNTNRTDLSQAVDGRVWFYSHARNYWTNAGSQQSADWFSLDFGSAQTVSSAQLFFYGDGVRFRAPTKVGLQYWTGQEWANVVHTGDSVAPVENGETTIRFAPVQTTKLRAVFTNPPQASVALVELKIFGNVTVNSEPPRTAVSSGLPQDPAGLQGENTHTGQFNGRQWRDADNGGFFAFELKTVPRAANRLVVTYWGGEVGNRRFDILIDGVKIAEQTLRNDHPGEFFEVSYPITETLTRGKPRVTVRFQARSGAIAGGVFGAQLAGP
jgi:hypothetical protein